MKFHTEQVEAHGVTVWAHPEMDALRKEQCMCKNCDLFLLDECEIADSLYAPCKIYDIALAVTRCPKWRPLPQPDVNWEKQL